MRALRQPLSFSEIQRELKYVTNRMLSRELNLLISERLVTHDGERYARTERGNTLLEALTPLMEWCMTHESCTHCPPEKSCLTCHGYEAVVKTHINS